MRPMKYGFLTFSALAGAIAVFAPACTETVVDPVEEDSGTTVDATVVVDATTPKDSGKDSTTTQDSGRDATAVDSGRDATTDAGSDASDGSVADSGSSPVTGTACTTVGFIYTKKCGLCGTQEAACEGDMKVGVYGACSGEVVGGCMPGTTRSSACGLCGTKSEICQNNCQWASGTCMGEPAGACKPGDTKFTTAGCSAPDTYRQQVCAATCTYGAPSAPPCKPKSAFCAANPDAVSIATTVGGQVSYNGTLSPLTMQIPRAGSGTCPSTLSSTNTSYAYMEIKNTTAMTAKVDIWFDAPPGGAAIDTVATTYPDCGIPPANRTACTNTVNDTCSTSPCVGDWAGLIGTNAVTIAPNSTITVYHAAYYSTGTGPFVMNVKTTSLL
ncbi:MAG: hypothetical protein HOO96_24725 [Polyangiaceae bacterium]|nr:hypothetical protein [Polyangiaceae bacterium]